MGDKRKKVRRDRSSGAEPQLPVTEVEHHVRKRKFSKRLDTSASVFLGGVLDYLTSNIVDLAGKEAHNSGNKVIAPEHVIKAVKNNKDLRQLLQDNEFLADETAGPDKTPGPSETPRTSEKWCWNSILKSQINLSDFLVGEGGFLSDILLKCLNDYYWFWFISVRHLGLQVIIKHPGVGLGWLRWGVAQISVISGGGGF